MSNPIIRLETLKQFVRNLILPLSEDVSELEKSVPSSTDKQNWDSAKKHADSAHARTDATKVEKSNTNGNILVNSSETTVYSHPTTAGNKHIPAGGSSGQILRWGDDGIAVWGADNNTTYTPASLGSGYGTCTTAAATVSKVVSLSEYALIVGGYVSVKFTYDVPASATLNINNKGAKAVYYKGAAIKAGTIKAGDIATFIYVNSQYHLVNIDKQIDTRLSVENGKVYLEYEQ